MLLSLEKNFLFIHIPKTAGSSLEFAVVGNPYDYAISYYEFVRQNQASKRQKRMLAISFEDFLQEQKQSLQRWDQSHWVEDKDGNLIIDKVMRFENLAADFDELTQQLSLAVSNLPHKNTSQRGSDANYLTNRSIKLIEEVFARDFERFNFEHPRLGSRAY